MTEQSPLTPLDCDLRDFKFMPLDVQRLRSSELVSDQTPEQNWAALMLWCAAWHEIPAGSVPDNDSWLAKHAGYMMRGRIDKGWEAIKAGALRGFVLCSDGRLYHDVVSEKAREAWQSKLEHAYNRIADRTRKANKVRTEKHEPLLPIPTIEWWISAGKPPEFPADAPGIPLEKALKGKGQSKGKGQGELLHPAGDGDKSPRPSKKCPKDFAMTPELLAWAREQDPPFTDKAILAETAKFRDYTFPRTISDWAGAWRNWMRKAGDDLKRHSQRASEPTRRENRAADFVTPRVPRESIPENILDVEAHDVPAISH